MLGFWIIVCHLVGDYLLQSDWMAQNKTRRDWPASVHAFFYTMTFAVGMGLAGVRLRHGFWFFFVLCGTHYVIDRYRLARYVVWAKNWIGAPVPWFHVNCTWTDVDEGVVVRSCTQPTPPLSGCLATGYPPNRPAWLSVWLLIIADNTLHLLIAGLALTFL